MSCQWSDESFARLAAMVGERTGLRFEPSRCQDFETAAMVQMRARRLDVEQYHARLIGDEVALDELLGEVTIGETYFFRHAGQFRFLADGVIPELQRARGHDTPIRCWSAGCASGEEAWSIAMVVERAGAGAGSSVLGTDLSRPALQRARKGAYRKWSVRGLESLPSREYLRELDGEFSIDERLRKLVRFEYLNLAGDAYPSLVTGIWGMDVIFCRNVLIYFGKDTIERVARRLYDSLASDGWLFTAASDPPLGEFAPFLPQVIEDGVIYRRAPLHARPIPLPAKLPPPLREAAPRTTARRAISTPIARAKPATASPTPTTTTTPTTIEEARQLLTRNQLDQARRMLDRARKESPLSPEVHLLDALLQGELGHVGDAVEAARRVVYLDPTLAIGHFVLGSLLRRLGDARGAKRAYHNSEDLAARQTPAEKLPLGDGETAGRLRQLAHQQLALLDGGDSDDESRNR